MEPPTISKRTIIRVGDSSAITIPPEWLKLAGLKIGDEVILVGDNELRIAPHSDKLARELHKRLEERK